MARLLVSWPLICRLPLEAKKFRQAITENTLRSCQFFTGLPAAEIAAIASFVIPKHLAKGDCLFREGDRTEGFYIVQRGAINVHRINAAGKEQVIHLFRPVESFAEAALATEGGYPADARATEETTVLLVPKTDFIELFRRKPELALRVGLAFEPLGRVMAHACGPDGRDERNAFAHAG